MAGSSVIRKGAWTKEEDNLLRKCIEQYGEQKWHQVPPRAGLNRCRKSCRLRWLNYLKPNIKRGEFQADEVDLILRLHKLLGNRWAMIAGRLPGRTANDVKNYWNTHIRKKIVSCDKYVKGKGRKRETVNIIRPRPWTFSKSLTWLNGKFTVENNVQLKENLCKPSTTLDPQGNENVWWENLLAGKEFDEEASSYSSMDWPDREAIANLWDQISPPGITKSNGEAMANLWDQKSPAGITKSKVEDHIFDEVEQSLPTELLFDVNHWSLFNTEQESFI